MVSRISTSSNFLMHPIDMGGITSSDSDVTAWIAAVGMANTTQAEVNALTTMVLGIKSDLSMGAAALNTKFDRFWVAGFCASASAALVDLAARSSYTRTVAPTFTGQKGETGNGTSQYIDIGVAPNALTNFTQNSASWFLYIQAMETRSATFYTQMGGGGAGHTNVLLTKNTGSTQVGWAVNDGSNGQTTTTTSQIAGRWCGERTAAGATQLYVNGALVGSGTNASGARDSNNLLLLADNNAGTPSLFTQSTFAAFYLAASLGSTAVAAVDARIHTCGNTINAANFP